MTIDGGGGFAVFALDGSFANAENRGNIVAEGGSDFLSNVFFGFVKDITAFGMTNDSIIDEAANL